jgi:glycosyltransferase involved in cell wall biosynthesis
MKANIVYCFGKHMGGGDSFLSRLRDQFKKNEVFSEANEADVILFNSHHAVREVAKIRESFPNKILIHRIDGPMRIYNGEQDKRDDIVIKQNTLADGIVFQSRWSADKSLQMYPSLCEKKRCVINNACCFERKQNYAVGEKVNLIITTVSNNPNKGFAIYKYLDDNLDFSKYNCYFLGNSPDKFKNIQHLGYKGRTEVEGVLKTMDIYFSGSKLESCSNSLIEALSVGLPCVVANGSSNPEILKGGGELFDGEQDVLQKVEKVSNNLDHYRSKIEVSSMKDVAEKYLSFFETIKKEK